MRTIWLTVVLLSLLPIRASADDLSLGLVHCKAGQFEEAVRELMPFAARGNAEAQYCVGRAYRGYPSNDDGKAEPWLLKAAEQGYLPAQALLGTMYKVGSATLRRNGEASFKWYMAAASQGDPVSAFNVGSSYRSGTYVPQDYQEAARWFGKAAGGGDLQSANNLAEMYERGQGVPQSYSEAVKWYRAVAQRPIPKVGGEPFARFNADIERKRIAIAQCNLGRLYSEGKGVRRDLVRSFMWTNLCVLTFPDDTSKGKAKELREKIASVMTPSQISEAQKLTEEWAAGRH